MLPSGLRLLSRRYAPTHRCLSTVTASVPSSSTPQPKAKPKSPKPTKSSNKAAAKAKATANAKASAAAALLYSPNAPSQVAEGSTRDSKEASLERLMQFKRNAIIARRSKDPTWDSLSDAEQTRLIEDDFGLEMAGQAGGAIWNFPVCEYTFFPYSIAPKEWKKYTTWKDIFDQALSNIQVELTNAYGIYTLAASNAIPGIDLPASNFWRSIQWLPKIFTSTHSTKPEGWMAPIRSAVLDSYKKMNEAIADKNINALSSLSQHEHYGFAEAQTRSLLKDHKYIWRFHREVSPTQIITIRPAQGYMAKAPPVVGGGNRHMIQVLCRFDTEQSMEIYSPTGHALHIPPADSHKQKRPGHIVAAQPKRVTEYLLMEKLMYSPEPWHARERFFPKEGLKVAV